MTREGDDVTAQFLAGAWLAVETALANGCRAAVLKRKSPSCGCGEIYDGSFSGTLTKGNGLAAQLLLEQGVAVYCEDDYGELFRD